MMGLSVILMCFTLMFAYSSVSLPRTPLAHAVGITADVSRSRSGKREVIRFEQGPRIHSVICQNVREFCAEVDRRGGRLSKVEMRYVDAGLFGGEWLFGAKEANREWLEALVIERRYRAMTLFFDALTALFTLATLGTLWLSNRQRPKG
jgi:hypothetical protein